jgi:VWFA-related protein
LRKNLLLVLLLAVLISSGVLAQQSAPSTSTSPIPSQQPSPTPGQKPESEDVVRITTNLVQVDAVVTDKDGKVVTDLKPEEVKIFEDGRAQKITHFSYNVTEGPAAPARNENQSATEMKAGPAPPVRLKPEEVRRTIAIVVDDLGLSFVSVNYVRKALKKFVDEQMQSGDLVAIIRTSGGMGALQQFTADKRQLYAAIDRVKWNSNGRGGVAAFAPLEPPTPGAGGPAIDAANEDLNQFREDIFAVGTLGAINYVIRGLKELPGRKSILLISDGFRIYNADDPSRNYLALDRLRRLVDTAGRASVVIYTMNATGLQTMGLTAADNPGGGDVEQMLTNRRNSAFETQEGLEILARETGGIPIKNSNDLSGGIRRVLEDQKGFYLIGYRPDVSTFDPRTGRRTFHKLTMKVLRPGKFNVRMRNGFYGESDAAPREPAPRTLVQQLVGAITSPFGAAGVHLQLTSLFSNDVKAGSFMRSMLHIEARDLTFTDEPDGTHKCVFDVLTMTFGDNGVPIDESGRTYTMRLPDAAYKKALKDGLVYYVTVPIKKAGAYQLRVSLRDSSTERIGSASQFIEVPDLKKDRLSISGIVLRGENLGVKTAAMPVPAPAASPGENQAANAGDPEAQSQAAMDQQNPQASPAVRHFTQGMLMQYLFVIYNAHIDKETTKPQLIAQVRLFRDGKPVFTGKEIALKFDNIVDPKRLITSGGIQLGTDLSPGEYVLQIVIQDSLADEKHRVATQWMDFEIVK